MNILMIKDGGTFQITSGHIIILKFIRMRNTSNITKLIKICAFLFKFFNLNNIHSAVCFKLYRNKIY